ncbi:putative MFS transporter [Talaromyces proteolyticus]|uniref:MFS transporter n=1 Tax=Talaromyces proteolyticus TaxID=1131652 RepID=A0AAD4PTB6_9EURO|nr:putative MFS transporter [Talaromyces proteolyticus]KAH8693030.1 putative MFS transporter [Talaromyces proteolyticus]
MSTWRLANIILAVAGVSFLSSFATGVLTIGLPQTAIDIKLSEDLIFWPSSVYSLASGSCLLLAGSVADVVGNRPVNLIGCFLVGCFILACGLARTGIELIMFRAMQGVAVSLCLPTSVAIVSNSVPNGRTRNIAFSCLGFVQPVGFSVGLVLGGLMLDTVGWRLGYYISGGLTFLLFMISVKALPAEKKTTGRDVITKLRTDIDWVGGFVSCVSLCLFSYILAALTNDISNIKRPVNITLLIIAVALVPVFILWEQRQERRGQPALMPNSLWKNRVFTNICLMVMFAWGVCNVMELFCSLFFQKVQNLNAFEASIRILPSMIVGSICQLSTGLLIHRISAFYLVVGSMILSGGGPLLMAVIDARWPYWYDAFFAQLLAPLSADILFTIGLLVVSDLFPTRTQALAGAVFNTVSQFGTSIGLTVMAVISSATTKHYSKSASNSSSPDALLVGYRAGFWAAFAWMMIAFLIGAFGLRNIGKVGLKRD